MVLEVVLVSEVDEGDEVEEEVEDGEADEDDDAAGVVELELVESAVATLNILASGESGGRFNRAENVIIK